MDLMYTQRQFTKKILRSKTLLRVHLPFWWGILLVLLCLVALLSLTSLAIPRWVEQGVSPEAWKASLLRCETCGGKWKSRYFSEILDSECEVEILGGICETFADLNKAGLLYLSFETVSLVGMTLWIIITTFRFINVNLLTKRSFTYSCIGTCLVFHLAAVLSWFLSSSAGFDPDLCSEKGTATAEPVCATYGPAIALIIGVVELFVAVLFFGIEQRRHKVWTN